MSQREKTREFQTTTWVRKHRFKPRAKEPGLARVTLARMVKLFIGLSKLKMRGYERVKIVKTSIGESGIKKGKKKKTRTESRRNEGRKVNKGTRR